MFVSELGYHLLVVVSCEFAIRSRKSGVRLVNECYLFNKRLQHLLQFDLVTIDSNKGFLLINTVRRFTGKWCWSYSIENLTRSSIVAAGIRPRNHITSSGARLELRQQVVTATRISKNAV